MIRMSMLSRLTTLLSAALVLVGLSGVAEAQQPTLSFPTYMQRATQLPTPMVQQDRVPVIRGNTTYMLPGASLNSLVVLPPNAKGDGITDDTAAFASFLTPYSGRILLPQNYTFHLKNLTLPVNTILDCQESPGSTGPNISASYNLNKLNGLRLDGPITLSSGSYIVNCPILRYGLTWPQADASNYAGTAINIASGSPTDAGLINDLIVGFNLPVDFSNRVDRFHIRNVETDGVNGFKIGQSADTSEIIQARCWPWGTQLTGVTTRTGTCFLLTGTANTDDLKGIDLTDFGHAIGMDIENPGAGCCNAHFDNVWLDNNATEALLNKGFNVTFGKLWVWTPTGPGIVLNGGLNTHFDQIYLTGGTDCIQLLGGANIQWNTAEFYNCSGRVVNMSTSATSRVKVGDLYIDSTIATTPYISQASPPTVGSSIEISSSRVPSGSAFNILGNASLVPLKPFGDEVTPTTGISAPTVVIAGPGQQTSAITDVGNLGGTLMLKASGLLQGDGGALLFGFDKAHMRHFAAIKGNGISDNNNTAGDIDFATRNLDTDVALTVDLHLDHAGFLQLKKAVVAANLVACSGTLNGATQLVSDGINNQIGATVNGGGSANILAECNGTNWVVASSGLQSSTTTPFTSSNSLYFPAANQQASTKYVYSAGSVSDTVESFRDVGYFESNDTDTTVYTHAHFNYGGRFAVFGPNNGAWQKTYKNLVAVNGYALGLTDSTSQADTGAAPGVSAFAGDAFQYGAGIASNEFAAHNPSTATSQSNSMAGVQGIIDQSKADSDATHTAYAFLATNNGTNKATAAYGAGGAGTYLRFLDAGSTGAAAIVNTAGIRMPASTAAFVGTIIDYGQNNGNPGGGSYTWWQGNVNGGQYIWVDSGANVAIIDNTGISTANKVSATGQISGSNEQNKTLYSAAGTPLPTCNGAAEGTHASVSDATGPTYGSTYTSGGAVHSTVYCNGTNWIHSG